MSLDVISTWRSEPGATPPTIWRLVYDGVYSLQSRTALTDFGEVAAPVALVEFIRRECERVGYSPPTYPPPALTGGQS